MRNCAFSRVYYKEILVLFGELHWTLSLIIIEHISYFDCWVEDNMSFKKSSSNTEKNKETWTKNLVQFQAPSRRGNVAIYEAPLSERSRMPLKNHVIGRFKFLESTAKERRERIGLIAVELKALWSKTLNFPHVSDQAICAKLANLLTDYELCRKKQNFDSLFRTWHGLIRQQQRQSLGGWEWSINEHKEA